MRGYVELLFVCVMSIFEYCWAAERIVGGRRAEEGEFKYQLSLRCNGVHLCGAALVNEKTALTAAHCLPFKGVYSVKAGSIKLKTDGQIINVQKAILHPYHNKKNQDYDIAILQLLNPFKYSSTIQPVKLPTFNERLIVGTKGYVTGWGSLNAIFQDTVEYLRAVELPILPHSYCTSRYHPILITDKMFCAGYREGGRDSCQGDSGGPFVINGTIYGIVSWGFNCAEPGYPGVYTNVAALRDFIRVNGKL